MPAPEELQVVGDIRSSITEQAHMFKFLEELKDMLVRYGVYKLDVALVNKEPPAVIISGSKENKSP